jgi:hypothetical protein
VQEFFALQIARQLSDLQGFRWYVHSLSGMAQADLLLLLRRTFQQNPQLDNPAECFRRELKELSTNFHSHA